MSSRAVIAVFLLAFAGCAAGEDELMDGVHSPRARTAPDGRCTITLQGNLSGTFACVASAVRRDGGDGTVIAANGVDLGGGLARITVAVKIPGEPVVETVTSDQFLGGGAVIETEDGAELVSESLGPLEVTAVDAVDSVEGGDVWTLHGTLSAHLRDGVELTLSF